MSLKLVFAMSLVAVSSAAQGPWRDPMLVIDLDHPGHVRAWLTMAIPVPSPVTQALTQAMGCPPAAVEPSDSASVHVDCAAPIKKDGLRWSARWDLTAFDIELTRAGASAVDLYVNHPRAGFSKALPASMSRSQGGFGVSYHGHLYLSEFHEITIEGGVPFQQVKWAAGVAGVILLLPLVLLAARGGGRLFALAGAHGLFCLGATAWLAAILPLDAPNLAPLPWSFALVTAPPLAAVWLGSRIAFGARWRAVFWRGTCAVAFLALIVVFFSPDAATGPWAGCCLAAILIAIWRMYRSAVGRQQPLAEGELSARVRELATRAGTTVKTVSILEVEDNLPVAFAMRYRGVLLSSGLLASLSRREVDAIVAHELSHLRHPSVATAKVAGFMLPGAIVLGFLVPGSRQWMPLLLPPFFLVHRAARRRNERQADADAVTWSGDAEALITGLTRVTRAIGLPLEWPAWVNPLMPHPSTMERVRGAAAQGRIREERFQQLLAAAEDPPRDCYPVAGSSAPKGDVFTPAARARLSVRISLLARAAPIVCGVAAPFLGYLAALLMGTVGVVLAAEWTLWKARRRARASMPGHPGVFTGFSPSLESRIYDGSYDYDWGFAAFEGDCLVFRGDRGSWSVGRGEIERIWLAKPAFAWMPRPLVGFQTRSGVSFSLRSFDGFGPFAPRSAARLLSQAQAWRRAADAGDAAGPTVDFSSMTGVPPVPFTWRQFGRALPRFSVFTLVIYWIVLTATPGGDLTDPVGLFGSIAVTCAVTLFVVYPNLRSSSRAVGQLEPVRQQP